jgi:type II secretory pathway pseudopilin PulG
MKGQSLIELLLVIGLTAIILPAILTGLVASRSGKVQQNSRLEAVAILKEAQEAVRNVREKDWNTFAVNGTFNPQISGSSWILATGSATINGFTRQVVISDVNRDPITGAIVLTGGTLDPSTKKVVTTISWTTPTPSFVTSTTYIARLDNITYTETLKAQFDAGTKTGTAVTNTSGGEITLGSGGQGDWCNPATPSGSLVLDLPKSGKATAVTAVFGEAYAGTGENSAGESLADIAITDANPPVASLIETVDGYKTNDIFGEPDYAYLATDKNNEEVVIYNISSTPFTKAGFFNAPPNENGDSIFVLGNIGYVVIKDTLYNFDLSSKTGSRPILDPNGVKLAKYGTSVYVVGTYAYVAISGDNNVQLEIIDVNNSSNMVSVGKADVNNQSAQDVFVNSTGTRAYVVTNATSPQEREFHIVNTENKSSPSKVGSGYYTTGMSPEGVEVVTGNKAIVVGQGGEEYQVVDITDENSPVRCGGLQIDTGIFDSASLIEPDGDAFTYIVTGDATAEFKIIPGGAGGVQYASSGTFESQTIPIPMPVNTTSFNRFEVSVNRPSQTDIQFQAAVAQAVLGSCNGVSFTFVGTDGTNSTFFTTSVTSGTQTFDYAIPTAINPGQCFRYKEFLSTSDSSQSPIFYDITINYAP